MYTNSLFDSPNESPKANPEHKLRGKRSPGALSHDSNVEALQKRASLFGNSPNFANICHSHPKKDQIGSSSFRNVQYQLPSRNSKLKLSGDQRGMVAPPITPKSGFDGIRVFDERKLSQ
jgi:hypothetical protein